MSTPTNMKQLQQRIRSASGPLRLNQALVEKIGMEQCKADPCVFRLRKDGENDDNFVCSRR